uniref:Vasotab-TY1 n=1 Tax=Tabanus yao TaxID=485572 RepID=VASO1_TABYA|nr:RecName: Full=Vasotab-TY1; AltName: Full=Vasotab TY; Flags: Precursor [Tabanus yao]ABX80080.1 vasotab TY [Tabanus yao]
MKFTLFSVLVVLLIATFVAADDCPRICTADFRPVCGTPSGGRRSANRTFGNQCSLDSHNCLNKGDTYDKLHDGECK